MLFWVLDRLLGINSCLAAGAPRLPKQAGVSLDDDEGQAGLREINCICGTTWALHSHVTYVAQERHALR